MEHNPFYNGSEDDASGHPAAAAGEPAEETSVLQDNILLDAADMSGYDKNLKRARIWLYVVTAMQVLMGVFEYMKYDTETPEFRWFTFALDAAIGLIFLACALWSYKKPVAAFLTALVLYIIITGSLMILDPSNIARGIILKILVVIALVRAYKDARHIEEMKQLLG